MKDLTIVLPTYNEEGTIGLVLEEILDKKWECKVLVINNRSTDKTREVALSYGGVEVIDENRPGKGNAILTGFSHVKTPFVAMINSDYTYPVEYISSIYGGLKYYNMDVMLGIRAIKEKGSMPFLNSLGNVALSAIASALYQKRVYDICTGMWGFKKSVLDSFVISSQGFTLEADLFSNAVLRHHKISQIPISYRKRPDGSEAKLKISDGVRIAWFLLKRRFSILNNS